MKRCLLLFVFIFARHLLSAQDIKADFSYDKTVGCGPLTVTFQDLSTGPANIVAWKWNFGDGDSSFVANPVHTYSQKGQFTVTLTVRDASGNVASNEYRYPQKKVVVLPVLNIGDEYLVCTMYDANNKVTLANKAAAPYASAMGHYEWSTGDTTASINVNTAGEYRVSYDVCGQSLRDTANVSVASSAIQASYRKQAQGWEYGYYRMIVSWTYPFASKAVDSVRINWGDGQWNSYESYESPSAVYAHNYTAPNGGTYRVSIDLISKEPNGLCDTAIVIPNLIVPETQVRLDLGPDTISIYRGDTLVLDAGNPGATYYWSPLGTSQTFKVTEQGHYGVAVYKGPDMNVDSIFVRVIDRPTKPDAHIGILQRECKTIYFADSSIVHPDYPVTKRYWVYGDGSNTNDTASMPVHSYLQDGQYNVTLMVGNSKGEWDTAYQQVTISSPPPYVNLGKDTILWGQSVTLGSSNPQGAQFTYLWSTGDTTRTKTVSAEGTYSVTVTNQACGTSAADTIRVFASARHLDAGFTSERIACRTIQFTDTSSVSGAYIAQWRWTFGDGTTDTVPNPAHTYTQAGTYHVTLKVTDNIGNIDTTYNFATLEAAPEVYLGPDIDTLKPGHTIAINAPYRAAYSYLWSTGDTTHFTLVDEPGTYWVRVTDRFCGTSSSDTIVVSRPGTSYSLQAGFVLQRTACRSFQFTDTTKITGAHIVKWNWQFGDGATDTTQNPAHTYGYDGPFGIILRVTDNLGNRDTAYALIDGQGAPFVNLGPDINTLRSGKTVQLGTYNPEGLGYDYRWSTGDTIRVINVSQPGTYWVKVTDRFCGNSASDTIVVTRQDNTETLEADFLIKQTACRQYLFTDWSTVNGASITQWYWQFGDNKTDTLPNPVHTYSQPGQYSITLRITDNLGRQDTVVKSVTIIGAPIADLGPDIDSLTVGGSVMLGSYLAPMASYQYLWSTQDTTRTITVTQPGTYWVKITDRYCGTSASDTIVMSGQPATGTDITGAINADEDFTINAQFNHPFNSNNVFTVQLLKGSDAGGRVTGETPGDILNIATIAGTSQHPALQVSIPDTVPCGQHYQLRIVSSSPADTTGWSSGFAIQNTPQATIRQQGDSLFAGKALTYQWYLNGTAIANAVQPSIRAKANGQYYVIVSNGESCRSTSATLNMIITAVPEITLEQNVVRAFPNPTPGIVYLRFAKPLLKAVDIVVLDNNGNIVYRRHTQDQTGEIDLSAQPKGVYYVTITGYGRQKAMRIVVQ
ncbi:PKD domain-containing protein [Chitinophaga agrisoli]|uniref:PKD domain-containing protein n=1 Tax=Chitinophaga agrisoli TaxID=2607653 RepID=A0A5B2VWQ2_9BACT|nr:PKD domain-containing protein [Chitinophaga agrisoli]KAA2243751.1 PKD domain-containing protein [Chitinophaga agrisoli]